MHSVQVTKSSQVLQLSKQPAHMPPNKKYWSWHFSITAIEHELTPVEQGMQLPLASMYMPVLQVTQVTESLQVLQPNGHLLHWPKF